MRQGDGNTNSTLMGQRGSANLSKWCFKDHFFRADDRDLSEGSTTLMRQGGQQECHYIEVVVPEKHHFDALRRTTGQKWCFKHHFEGRCGDFYKKSTTLMCQDGRRECQLLLLEVQYH
jgi:hypothetical protein